MRIKSTGPTKLRILFFLFYLSISFSPSSHAQDREEKTTKRDAQSSGESKNSASYSVKKPSLVLLNQNAKDQLKLSATEVFANPGDGSVFISPKVEFAIGGFTYLSESDKAETDYRPSNDGLISLSGSVNLIRYSSDASDLSITSDLLTIDLLNEKITGAGSIILVIGDSTHTGAYFSIEREGIFRLIGEDRSQIKGEIQLTAK
tara:strand:+ start:263 stop:874 length:612 start_codon:yes stop_codon:yes gene_type:complete